MSARVPAVIVAATIACAGSQRSPLSKAGDERDDGAGELARASLRFETPDDDAQGFGDRDASQGARRVYNAGNVYGGDPYGGNPYGGFGDPYGGAGYANWRPPQWSYNVPNRTPRYSVSVGLTGAIEGTVTWDGQLPAKLASACGPIDNPTLRVSKDRALRGVIVYIEKIAIGRATPYYSRPASVGGVLAKRGCALVPSAQIVAPLPGAVSVHGDGQRTKLRVGASTQELQEAGLVQIEVEAGVTKIESDDGKLAAAWVLGLETPYYAITDDLGRFRIDELAPGTYELTFWQPPVASTNRDGTFSYGPPIVAKRTVTVGATTVRLSVRLPSR